MSAPGFTRDFIVRGYIIGQLYTDEWDKIMNIPILQREQAMLVLHARVTAEIVNNQHDKLIEQFNPLLKELCCDDPDPIDPQVYAQRLLDRYNRWASAIVCPQK
jgi:hypothetical protein